LKKILPLFSYLFHPIFIPVFGALFYLFWNDSYFALGQKYLILLQIIIITVLIPIAFFYLLKTLGKVDSVMVSDLTQRKIPLLIQIILIFILLKKSITIDRIPELFFFLLGGLISTLLTLSFLLGKLKISIHMIGISALTVFAVGLSIHSQANFLNIIAFLILMNGLIAASRLYMKAHTMTEIVLGFLAGTIPQLGLWYCWL
jgi:membrane-associated phospholipid phosphatase